MALIYDQKVLYLFIIDIYVIHYSGVDAEK